MLHYQRDLWSDFRAVHRLSPDQALALPGPEYMALAWRLPAYGGVLANRMSEKSSPLPDDLIEWG